MESNDTAQIESGDLYEQHEYFQSLDILRLLLMILASASIFGVGSGGVLGKICESVAGIAPLAFYIISGFLVLSDDSERTNARIGRTIGRTAVMLLIMALFYFGVNALFCYLDGQQIFGTLPAASKRFWFQTLVINIWPYAIGQSIWYVQALLYGYIVIYILRKLHLAKIEWLLFILLEAFAFASGEFAGVLNFAPLAIIDMPYIPECFFTCAIPYLLLGGIIRRSLDKLSRISTAIYVIGAISGVALSYGEEVFLSGNGYAHSHHFIGTAIASFCLCAFVVFAFYGEAPRLLPLSVRSRVYIPVMYLLLEAVGIASVRFFSLHDPYTYGILEKWIFALVYVISFVIAVFACLIWENFMFRKKAAFVEPKENEIE